MTEKTDAVATDVTESAPAPEPKTMLDAPEQAPADVEAKEEAKTEEPKSPTEPQVPEAYDIKAAEGVEIDQEALAQFTPIAKELKLTNDQAQKLADLYAARMQKVIDDRSAAYAKQMEGWANEVMTDKEIGGDNWVGTQVSLKKALGSYDADGAFLALMNESGYGNHPAVVRFVARVGAALKEDRAQVGGQAAKKKTLGEILYGS